MKHYNVPAGFRQINLEQVDSTSHFARTLPLDTVGTENVVVTAEYQTVGRGQRGNSWESEPGKNLLFSVLLYPSRLTVAEQFGLSCAVSLAVRDTLAGYVENASVKWPNDVYVGERKVCGILIECDLSGDNVTRACLGVGINVNQKLFCSDAPNPVSMRQLTGKDMSRSEILYGVLQRLDTNYRLLCDGGYNVLLNRYCACLFRKEGLHRFRDANGLFSARIENVELDGHLILRDELDSLRWYMFKEVKYVFSDYMLV